METKRAEARGRVGKSAGRVAKKSFLLTVIGITSIYSFAATDVLFLVDTTGSMSGLSNFQTAFNGIIDAINTNSSCPETIMYGVADYKNYADGGNYQAYGVNLDQPFTYSAQVAISVINGLSAGGGGDDPESQLKAMVSIASNWLTTSGDLGFHGRSGAQKMIIWAGDIYGHIAGDEPGSDGPPPTGYYPTLDAVIDALTAQGIIVFALNPSNYNSGLNEAYNGKYHQISPERQQASEITEATGGELFNNVGSGSPEIKDVIVGAIRCYSFDKDDDLNDANSLDCRSPNQELVYSICLTNDSDQTIENAHIVDWLPDGTTYPITYTLDPNTGEIIPSDPNYDPNTHSYTWSLDPIAPTASVCVTLTVIVNENAEPGMYLHNVAELVIGEDVAATAPKDTLVCCWDTSGILYVDKNAPDGGSGISWANAYNDLQDALYRAENSVCVGNFTIYVAQGTYDPNTAQDNSFVLPEGTSVYGGFPTGGCNFAYRNSKKYITILTGQIDKTHRSDSVVVMGNNSLLDGVIVRNSDSYAILGLDVDFEVSNCIVEENKKYGIYADNSTVELKWCRLENNGYDGIRHIGNGKSILVENCQVNDNGRNGVRTINSAPTIKNSVICKNGSENTGFWGIWIANPNAIPMLYNNTISYNWNEAIAYTADNDPNHVNQPAILNCVIWYNNQEGSTEQFAGWKVPTHYSCVYDPNDPNGVSEAIDPNNHNFSHKPDFAYPYSDDPNVFINVHLRAEPNSFCKDKGNPGLSSYADQNDIDGEARVADGRVDVGADEVSCNDVYNAYDWNADGLVNYGDFNYFSHAWLSRDPNDPSLPADANQIDPNEFINWDSRCDLNQDYRVDLPDVIIFMNDWLWKACWRHDIEQMQQQMSMLALSNAEGLALNRPVLSEVEGTTPPASSVSEISPPVETTVSVPATESVEAEEVSPEVEQANIMALLEDINGLIDAGDGDVEAWREIKNLLEQTLAETEDTANDPNEI